MTWSFVAASTAQEAASGNLTLTEPAGVAQGDLLVAVIAYRGSAAFTLPAGWTIVGTQQSSGDTAASGIASGVMAYIQRGASAPALAWTRTGGDVARGQIVAYRSSRSGTIRLDAATAATMAVAGTAVSMAGVTASEPRGLVVMGLCGAANGTASAFSATRPGLSSGATATTAPDPGNWTERADSGTATGADCSLAIAEGLRASGGPTGNLTVTHSVSARHVTLAGVFLEPVRTDAATVTFDPEWSYDVVLSAGNLVSTGAAAGGDQYYNWAIANAGKSSGKWYWEIVPTTRTHPDGNASPGLMRVGHDADRQLDATDTLAMYWTSGGSVRPNWTAAAYGTAATWTQGNTLCFAADLDAAPPKFWFRVGAGNWNNDPTANPATGIGGFSTANIPAGSKIYPLWGGIGDNTQDVATANFGPSSAQAVPSGFSTLTSSSSDVTVSLTGVSGTGRVGALGTNQGRVRFVSPSGSDAAAGTDTAPWLTLQKAHDVALAGDVIFVRGGTYALSGLANLVLTRDGASGNPICLHAYPGETPVLDGSALTGGYYDGWAIEMNAANWWHLRGLEVANAPDGGIVLSNGCTNNILEMLNVHHHGLDTTVNAGTGISIYDSSANNTVLNCDVHDNNAAANCDGIQVTAYGAGNKIQYNRCWNNTDDNFDFYNVHDGTTQAGALIEGNWAIDAGKFSNGTASTGDGNGFKLGGEDNGSHSGGHIVRRNLAVRNRVNGIDENGSSVQITLYHNTAYANGNRGFYLYNSGNGNSADHIARNNLQYANGAAPINSPTGTTNNSWQLAVTVNDSDFQSIGTSDAAIAVLKGPRQHNGALPDITFLKLAAGSDLLDKGVNVGLPYDGAAPDLGAFESTAATTTINVALDGVSGTGAVGALAVATDATVTLDGVAGTGAVGALKVLGQIDADFVAQTYVVDNIPTTLAALLATDAAASRQVKRQDGGFDTVAAGVVARSDLGLTAQQGAAGGTSDNLVPSSNMQGGAGGSPGTAPTGWTISGFGGLARTITIADNGDGRNRIDIRFNGTSNGSEGFIFFDNGTRLDTVVGQTYKPSIDLARTAGSFSGVTFARQVIEGYDDPTGSAGYTFVNQFDFFSSITATVQRYAGTYASAREYVSYHTQFGFTNGAAVDFTIRILSPYFGIAGVGTAATAAETLTAIGPLLAMLQGDEGALLIEGHQVSDHPGLSTISGKVASGGAGGAVELLGVKGGSAVKASGITAAPAGAGGVMGLWRAMVTWDASGTKLCLNNGDIVTGPALGARSGNPVQILQGLAGYIRRIKAWNWKQADATLQSETTLANAITGSPGALALTGRSQTFDEPWTQFALGGNIMSIGSATPSNAAYAAATGQWKAPYGKYYVSALQNEYGNSNEGNGEYQWYPNIEHPDWVAAGYNPFSIVTNDAGQASALRIRATDRTQWSAAVKNLVDTVIPKDKRGAIFQYLSGMLTTHRSPDTGSVGFSQENGYIEVRAKVPPAGQARWPAAWLMFDDDWPPEIDLLERFGSSDTGFVGTIHWDRAGWHALGVKQQRTAWYSSPVDLANDWHTYGVDWKGHHFDYYLDGKLVFSIDISDDARADIIGRRGWLLLNLAIGGDWVGAPDATTGAVVDYDIDYVRVFSAVSGDVTASLTGVSGTGAVGTLVADAGGNVTALLTGVSGTGEVGTLAATAVASVTVALDGVSGTGEVGSPAILLPLPPTPRARGGSGGSGGPAGAAKTRLDEEHRQKKRRREKVIEDDLADIYDGKPPRSTLAPPGEAAPEPGLPMLDLGPLDGLEASLAAMPQLPVGLIRSAQPPGIFDPEDDADVVSLLL